MGVPSFAKASACRKRQLRPKAHVNGHSTHGKERNNVFTSSKLDDGAGHASAGILSGAAFGKTNSIIMYRQIVWLGLDQRKVTRCIGRKSALEVLRHSDTFPGIKVGVEHESRRF